MQLGLEVEDHAVNISNRFMVPPEKRNSSTSMLSFFDLSKIHADEFISIKEKLYLQNRK